MSLAVTHFALGTALTLLLVGTVAPRTRYRATLGVVGGLWALVPDFHYVLPGRWPPLSDLKHTVFGDLFWFHATLDVVETGRGSRRAAAVALAVLLGAAVAVEWSAARADDGTNGQVHSVRK